MENLVFKANQPNREKLEEINEGKEKYKEVALRLLESAKGMSINNEIKEKYLKDIKDGKVSKFTYEMAEENKGLIGPIDSFVRTIVGRGEARRFRELKEFLCDKGVNKFKALINNKAQHHVSSMLLGVESDAVSVFNRLYDKLFDEDEKETEFQKNFKGNGLLLSSVSSMLSGAGSQAPEALEKLVTLLNSNLPGQQTTYLAFLKGESIISSVSSMLNGAGSQAPEDLVVLCKVLNKKMEIGNKEKTCLEIFAQDKEIMKSISSMLHGAGQNAHTALDKLLTTKIKIGNKEKTCLEIFAQDKEIMKSISSMLHGAGQNAHTALEDLLNTLNKDRNINEEPTTCLKFFKKNKEIMKSISSMLSRAGSKAPDALEKLIGTLTEERTINGKTYLEFLKDNGILSNVSSMLNGAGSKAPDALKGLLNVLNPKIDSQQGKKTYLECFSEKGITNEVIIGSLREWKKQRSKDYNKWFENYFDKRLKNLTEKNVSSQENISPQQQGGKRKLKGSEKSTTRNYSKKKKANTEVMSSGCSDEERQEVFSCLSGFILHNFPDASVKSVRQGLHLPSFEKRGVKVNGKCVAITRSFSQALFFNGERSFLSNLEILAEIYERKEQGKQISKREEKEVCTMENLVCSFEEQLDFYENSSLPLSLIHHTKEDCKTFSDLSNYIAEIEGNFAIHLITSNHVVAVYRTGDNYSYFDSNTAFVSGLKSIDQLMQVIEEAMKFAGYKVEEKGLLVEHFDVARANNLLSIENKQVLTKEIKTERQLLAELDKELDLIKINGQEVSRVQLYDFGTKINMEGGVPLLINAEMNLSSKKFQDHLDKKEVSMTAREYLDSLKDSKNVEEVVQATKIIPFIGSNREIKEAEQTRRPKQSLLELTKGTINCILAAVSLSWSKSQLLGKTDDKPRTCLNDPTVDKHLQRSL